MFLSLFSVVKSADSNEVISYSYTSEKLESFQIKSGGTKIESRSSILKPSLVENEPSSQLVWSSKDMFIILGGGANKSLFIFRRALDNEVEPILIKKLASVSAYDVISKESGEFFLVFAEQSQGADLKRRVKTIEVKSGQERADLSFAIGAEQPDDQKFIIQVIIYYF